MAVVLTIAGIVACALVALPLLGRWLEKSRPDSTAAQAMGAGFQPLESVFNPGRQHQQDYLEHEAQAPARQTNGAPPRVRYDPNAGIVIANEAKDRPAELPYTGPTTERTGPETR
ncbi:hypothetical protein [Flindersiella endophytica]